MIGGRRSDGCPRSRSWAALSRTRPGPPKSVIIVSPSIGRESAAKSARRPQAVTVTQPNRASAYADLPGWWRLMLFIGAVLIGMGWAALATSALQGVSVLSTGSSSRAWWSGSDTGEGG